MLRLLPLVLILIVTACGKKAEEARGPVSPYTVIGTLTQEQVGVVASKIGGLVFPARRDDVVGLLPSALTPDNVAIYEAALHGEDASGRNGGRIEDYWLNSEYVVRVGVAYYPEKGPKVEWATVLKAKDRGTYKRYPYPALEKEANQVPEPTSGLAPGRGSS